MSASVDSAPLEPLRHAAAEFASVLLAASRLDALDSVAQRRAYPRTAAVVTGCDEVPSTLSLPANSSSPMLYACRNVQHSVPRLKGDS